MMSRIYFALLAIAIAAAAPSCKPKVELEEVEAEDGYGYLEKYQRRKDDFAREGWYQKLSPEGNKVEEAQYQRDTLHGLRILYGENGDTLVVETYRMGWFDGPFRAFRTGGELEIEGQYEANVMHGLWKRYYPGGQLMEVVTFADNEENGPFVEYWQNGNIKAEGTYLNGDHEHGLLKMYDENGELARTMNCERGVCRTVWKAEGVVDPNPLEEE